MDPIKNICILKHADNSLVNVPQDLVVQPLPHCCRKALSMHLNSRQERGLVVYRNSRTLHRRRNRQYTYLCQVHLHRWTYLTINRQWENGLTKTYLKQFEWTTAYYNDFRSGTFPNVLLLSLSSNSMIMGVKAYGLVNCLPHTASMVKDIAIIKSVHTDAINHDPAITFVCTGDETPGKPSLGAWLSYGLGSENQNLPAFIVMNATWSGPKGAQALYNRPLGFWFPSHLSIKGYNSAVKEILCCSSQIQKV